jgi:lipoprotein NlpD
MYYFGKFKKVAAGFSLRKIFKILQTQAKAYGYKYLVIFLLVFSFIGCTKDNINAKNLNGKTQATSATVVEGWQERNHKHDYYIVQKWDSLYSLAWSFQIDYRDLIKINHLQAPYKLRTGQRIYMSNAAPTKTAAVMPTTKWFYPAEGKIVQTFSSYSDGIDISGKAGEPIIAVASGKVVYTGSAIHGMGELIMVKHNDNYFSAYAQNQKILVKEGQNIFAGEKIALMGIDKNKAGILHFEIRCNGKPQDPQKFLNSIYVPAKTIKNKKHKNSKTNVKNKKHKKIKTKNVHSIKTNLKNKKNKKNKK